MQYDRQKEFKKHELSEGMGICSESQTSQMNASRSKLCRQQHYPQDKKLREKM